MYNILHISDIHVGAVPYGMRQRGRDIDACLSSVSHLLLSGPVQWDALIIAGDAFDKGQVGPMDYLSMRRLLSAATTRHIPVYWVEGDHDSMSRDRVLRDDTTWPRLFAGEGLFVMHETTDPGGTIPGTHIIEKHGHTPLSVCPINWRPGGEIRKLLELIPNNYCDIMVMHQSLEGVVPMIGNPEVRVEDLDGKAKYFAMGDLHVDHVTDLPSGGRAAYPGPLEWLATDQADSTGYRHVCFDEGGGYVSSTHIRTASRRLVRIVAVQGGLIDLTALMPEEDWGGRSSEWIEVGSPGNSVRINGTRRGESLRRDYLFEVRYFHTATGETRQLAETLRSYLVNQFAGSLGKVSQIPSVDPASGYLEGGPGAGEGDLSTGLGSITMEEAIRRECAEDEDPEVMRMALDVWSHPEVIQAIVMDDGKEVKTEDNSETINEDQETQAT